MSKYRNSRPDSKNFKFFSPQVFQIFDSKHGSPDNYSDFFFKLNNYVVQLIGSSSVQHDFGLLRFFLLLNDSSHDAHFSTRQNMEPEESLEKKSNFYLHGFSRYSTPNMALQKIILTSFVFKLNNYVVQLIALASVLSRHGSFTIFLLPNDPSHDAHFSTPQNIKPGESLEKKSNFSLHGFFRYLTSNMALQIIILTSF